MTFGEAFQSTHPVRGATFWFWFWFPLSGISIHAPREGCDVDDAADLVAVEISIHAPREGCDSRPTLARNSPSNFNPRTP